MQDVGVISSKPTILIITLDGRKSDALTQQISHATFHLPGKKSQTLRWKLLDYSKHTVFINATLAPDSNRICSGIIIVVVNGVCRLRIQFAPPRIVLRTLSPPLCDPTYTMYVLLRRHYAPYILCALAVSESKFIPACRTLIYSHSSNGHYWIISTRGKPKG